MVFTYYLLFLAPYTVILWVCITKVDEETRARYRRNVRFMLFFVNLLLNTVEYGDSLPFNCSVGDFSDWRSFMRVNVLCLYSLNVTSASFRWQFCLMSHSHDFISALISSFQHYFCRPIRNDSVHINLHFLTFDVAKKNPDQKANNTQITNKAKVFIPCHSCLQVQIYYEICSILPKKNFQLFNLEVNSVVATSEYFGYRSALFSRNYLLLSGNCRIYIFIQSMPIPD